jgi:DNA-binding XRE family transcriptional regulator
MRVENIDLRSLREKTGLTVDAAAELVGVSRRIWQRWERPKEERHRNTKNVPSSIIELFCLKTGAAIPEEVTSLRNEYYTDEEE